MVWSSIVTGLIIAFFTLGWTITGWFFRRALGKYDEQFQEIKRDFKEALEKQLEDISFFLNY